MANKKIINKLVDLQGTNFEVTDVKIEKRKIIWIIKHKKNANYRCPICFKKHKEYYDKKWITIKDVPLGNKRMLWEVLRFRISCKCYYKPMVEYLPFRSKHHRLTQRFVELIEEILSTKMFTVADVARLFEIDYGVVYKIDHELLWRLVNSIKIPHPENISVDEKSFRKGHKYVTVVTDTDIKKVIWVSEGRKKESLDEFFKIIGPEASAKIKTISKDLHEAYSLSIAEHAPQAEVIADKFHVMKHLNEAIDEYRKELISKEDLKKFNPKKRSEHLQWLIRYNFSNLGEKQLEKLDTISGLNMDLYKAYLLKEMFNPLFDFKPSEIKQAKGYLLSWIMEVMKTKFKPLKKFAEFAQRHLRTILNIVLFRKSSAISEGINRKISVIKSMAYGYRNIQYFKLKIMQRCGILGDPNLFLSDA